MKNVTLSADEDLVEQARMVARQQHRTLNGTFREWLLECTAQSGSGQDYGALMDRLHQVRAAHVSAGMR